MQLGTACVDGMLAGECSDELATGWRSTCIPVILQRGDGEAPGRLVPISPLPIEKTNRIRPSFLP